MRMFPRKTDTTSGEFWESFPMEDSFRSDRNRLCRPLSSSAKTSVLYSVTNADGDGREVPRRIVLNNSLRGSPVSRTGESRQGLLEVDQKCSPSQLIKRHQLFPVEVPWLPKSLALRLPPVPPFRTPFSSSHLEQVEGIRAFHLILQIIYIELNELFFIYWASQICFSINHCFSILYDECTSYYTPTIVRNNSQGYPLSYVSHIRKLLKYWCQVFQGFIKPLFLQLYQSYDNS